MLKKMLAIFFLLGVIAIAGGAGAYYHLVVLYPGEEIGRDNIQRILARESEVYYSDGETRLGVFFDTAHRQYVPFRDIPKAFVDALVAAEDERFFSHIGFDPFGIARAVLRNIEAGRVVEGGSTLSQQTAKNLFKRTERSLTEKLKELLYALRLEYHYSKEEIFEFYANQFYVSGNGHGLGVAARYYFDKDLADLSLLECAYIAGSVKRPNFYNPFIKKTAPAAEQARRQGKIRLNYVLGKMNSLGMISETTYRQALAEELALNQGRVGYALDYALEQVREAVSSSELQAALEEQGIDNIATSGVRIITTVDQDLQHQTLMLLRTELSRLDVRLRGYDHDEVQSELAALEYSGDSDLEEGAFLFGTVTAVNGERKNVRLEVELAKNLGGGVITSSGLEKLVTALVKYQRHLWTEVGIEDQQSLLAELRPGDRVWVRVLSVAPEIELELARYPFLQGGAIIVRDGMIKGIAGGSDNRFYNRATQAKRTLGSAFKILVYAAALQLGWNSTDLLNNQRNLFVYHGQPYFPRPDHQSPFATVSMNWAGVLSENLASVWLLAHLCDHLSMSQFRDLAENLGLAPRVVDGVEEPYRNYRARIRDRYGIVVTRQTLREAAYRQAVANLESDFIFAGRVAEYQLIRELPYGHDFPAFRQEVEAVLAKGGLGESARRELELRQALLSNHFLLLDSSRQQLTAYRRQLMEAAGEPFLGQGTGGLWHDQETATFHFFANQGGSFPLRPVAVEQLRRYLAGLDDGARQEFWESVRLEGLAQVGTIDRVVRQLEEEEKKLVDTLPYSFAVLAQVEDFRQTVSLQYLVRLGEALGIRSSLEPVLSFPLGSSVVSLLEGTRMYEALLTGRVTTFGASEGDGGNDNLAIIDRIESPDGRVLYRPTPSTTTVIDRKTSLALAGILENVVKFGTGRAADRSVRFREKEGGGGAEIAALDLKVPLLGKTGTANNYTNAAFLGYVPGIAESGSAMRLEGGYAVGVYVGFDDNQEMRRGSTRITGASGALPTWSGIAEAILAEQHYLERLDPVDLSFYGLRMVWPELGQSNLAADPDQGGKIVEPPAEVGASARYQPAILTFGEKTAAGRFLPERNYLPFWQHAASGE